MAQLTREQFAQVIEQLKPDECNVKYCFFKQYLASRNGDLRTLIQLKCIEKFKWERSVNEAHDIGWQDAGLQWVDMGFAKEFAKVYDENLTVNEIYLRTIHGSSAVPLQEQQAELNRAIEQASEPAPAHVPEKNEQKAEQQTTKEEHSRIRQITSSPLWSLLSRYFTLERQADKSH